MRRISQSGQFTGAEQLATGGAECLPRRFVHLWGAVGKRSHWYCVYTVSSQQQVCGGKQTIAAITAGAGNYHDFVGRLRPQHIQGGIGHGSGGELHHLVVGNLMGQECFFRSADLISRISEHKPSLTTPAEACGGKLPPSDQAWQVGHQNRLRPSYAFIAISDPQT